MENVKKTKNTILIILFMCVVGFCACGKRGLPDPVSPAEGYSPEAQKKY